MFAFLRDFINLILRYFVISIVLIYYTCSNILSFDTIENYGVKQYLNNIINVQLWDIQYILNESMQLYQEPILISEIGKIKPILNLKKGNVISVSGSYTPNGNNISWMCTKVYLYGKAYYGYVLSPNGNWSYFGPYVNDDIYFTSFDLFINFFSVVT